MKRRELLGLLAVLPFVVRADSPRVAVMATSTAKAFESRARSLRRSLPGVALEFHYADGHYDKLDDLARKIVATDPAVIVSSSALTTRPLRQATATIPIVMASGDDPVADRFVKTLAQPGG